MSDYDKANEEAQPAFLVRDADYVIEWRSDGRIFAMPVQPDGTVVLSLAFAKYLMRETGWER